MIVTKYRCFEVSDVAMSYPDLLTVTKKSNYNSYKPEEVILFFKNGDSIGTSHFRGCLQSQLRSLVKY